MKRAIFFFLLIISIAFAVNATDMDNKLFERTVREAVELQCQNVEKYICPFTSDRLFEFREKYNGLSYNGKECFSLFVTGNKTNSFMFSSQCKLQGGALQIEYVLREYLEKGLAKRKCDLVNVPKTMLSESGEFKNMDFLSPYCFYYPYEIPLGCVDKVEEINDIAAAEAATAFWEGVIGTAIIAALLLILILFIYGGGIA